MGRLRRRCGPDRVAQWIDLAEAALIARTEGQYPDSDGRPISVITAHNPAGATASGQATPPRRRAWSLSCVSVA